MLRIFIATAIISLGISSAAYFITQKPLILVPSLNTDTPQKQISNNPVQNLFVSANPNQPMVENWSPKSPKSSEKPKSDSNQNPTQNLTEQFTQNFIEVIADSNPEGPTMVDNKPWLMIPDPENLSADLITQLAGEFDLESLKPTIKNSDLIISQDNSRESLTNYALSVDQAIKDLLKIPGIIQTAPKNNWLDSVNYLADMYQEIIGKLYKTKVPDSALEIHKKSIQLLGLQKNIFELIIDYQKDPIKAFLAMNLLKESPILFKNFENEVANFMKNNNLR